MNIWKQQLVSIFYRKSIIPLGAFFNTSIFLQTTKKMGIRPLSSTSFFANEPKRIKMSNEDLDALFSDSGEWEVDMHNEVKNDVSENDDDVILMRGLQYNPVDPAKKLMGASSIIFPKTNSEQIKSMPSGVEKSFTLTKKIPQVTFKDNVDIKTERFRQPLNRKESNLEPACTKHNELRPSFPSEKQTPEESTMLRKPSVPPVTKWPTTLPVVSNSAQSNISMNDSSLEIIKEETKVTHSNKFTLLTQPPTFTNLDMETPTKKLNLPKNTKIKIPIRLSTEQENIITLAEKGINIFYTGSAGTGKSILLREMIRALRRKYDADEVAVTASTGLAACNIGGITVHSFAGIGLGNGEAVNLYKKVRRSKKHLRRWQKIKALVVDEISMIDGKLLDKLDYIAQKIRKNHAPFGGIQLIFCGDFFQLPPVSKDPQNPTVFAFESKAWKAGIKSTIMLQKVFRQQGDAEFITMLNQMRLGKIDENTEREFKKLTRPLADDEIIPAELYSTRAEVDRANFSRLNKLPGLTHTFESIDGGELQDQEMKERLLQNFLAPKTLQLKVGAQVMMIKNMDETLVNGSLGKILAFVDPQTYMFYKTISDDPTVPLSQLEDLVSNPQPLMDSWNEEKDTDNVRQKSAKDSFCRPKTTDIKAELDDSIFDFLDGVEGQDIEIDTNIKRKKELMQMLHASSNGRKLPLVRFKTSDLSTRTILVEPENWAIEDENEKPIVSRVQLPLMLAWSLSIHKAQGQTLPKVKVDLRRVFEKGQAYVALSRAVSREGLQVLNFDRTRILSHQAVIDFYSTLTSAENAIKQFDHLPKETSSGIRREYAPTSNYRASRSSTKTPAGTDGILALLEKHKK
ncbi:DNA helicase PIF1 NDAI_0D04800 [Naumovozyma dairenensis CBS 421]|uniref:ATP-dependent DNA helicase PIF1 n=1 Tax=Naumovozyma dairenensis (strain ATCC 10597 / BCRC 20456 / CBS 421 / NBRC 0211 / NRRL Y-12639) TaxID=1071378 RepID=G0WAI2_NAUDC|nr:hypothetical protein NDAI_0D04800 [Naumovozyma dairenensis CBS 421]CCD24793.1 hypothetical protein NDAI_0D04800 [Naumovozyma dairenensis CBS 421]